MALLLAVSRRVAEADSYIRTGRWKGWTPTLLEGRGLNGRVLGIIGLGRIGCAVARMANAFGMKVRYWSRNRKSSRDRKRRRASRIAHSAGFCANPIS